MDTQAGGEPALPDLAQLLTTHATPLAACRSALRDGDAAIHAAWQRGVGVRQLVAWRTLLVDGVLQHLWRSLLGDALANELAGGAALIAVGGYGRGELHPHSDVDIMLLLAAEPDEALGARLGGFITALWDLGLDIGHSVRSLDACVAEAIADVTVISNLIEARLLDGDAALFGEMLLRTGPEHIWPSDEFFRAKLQEQHRRHRKFHDTGYKLEPNIKESRGGLRDIQMIGWVLKRHFGAASLDELVAHGFLTGAELAQLLEGQDLLWSIRYLLHHKTGRREDRLLFDHQRDLAHEFGYTEDANNQAIEQFMQRYYRTVMALERHNELLLQLFREAILEADQPAEIEELHERFQLCNGALEVKSAAVFEDYPPALLECFLVLARRPDVKGIRADTIRLIRRSLPLIDERFRDDITNRRLFMEILRQPQGIVRQLRRMNRYGVMAAYLPAFEQIVGRMQYDLFHVYTVDEHTIRVIRNLRTFFIGKHREEHPHCHAIAPHIHKPELLFLTGLFHDIAKGRGGDHSALGAADAAYFCRSHGLHAVDAKLVAWLVSNHLLMSQTAQRRDISDPQVIYDFASAVSSARHLNHLYLLTVADICGTNPELWNSWKESLLRNLYESTAAVLRRGLDNPLDKRDVIAMKMLDARQLLRERKVDGRAVRRAWREFGERYFLRYHPDEICWHTQAILRHHQREIPLVLLRRETQMGSTEIFIYVQGHQRLFALVTAALERLGLSVVSARIVTGNSGHALDTFLVLEADGSTILDPARLKEIRTTLERVLGAPDQPPGGTPRPLPRRLRMMARQARIEFDIDRSHGLTSVSVFTSDQPGLLAKIAQAFADCELEVHAAKIATFGDKVEDFFFVSDQHGQPVENPVQLAHIKQTLQKRLEPPEQP